MEKLYAILFISVPGWRYLEHDLANSFTEFFLEHICNYFIQVLDYIIDGNVNSEENGIKNSIQFGVARRSNVLTYKVVMFFLNDCIIHSREI